MGRRIKALLAMTALAAFPSRANAGITLGTAGDFAVLGGSAVTNTGPSIIQGGDVGGGPGSTITGFPPGRLAAPYTFHAGDSAATRAHEDLRNAFNAAAALTPTQELSGRDLGGLVLTPGVYSFSSSAQLTGMLTLDDLGDPNAQFVFQIASTLTTATNSSVVTIDGGSSPGGSVFWQVGSSATLGAGGAFEGHILALTSITVNSGATILDGSVLAIGGVVTLDSNEITNFNGEVPEPASLVLALVGGVFLGLTTLAKRSRGPRRREIGTPGHPRIPLVRGNRLADHSDPSDGPGDSP